MRGRPSLLAWGAWLDMNPVIRQGGTLTSTNNTLRTTGIVPYLFVSQLVSLFLLLSYHAIYHDEHHNQDKYSSTEECRLGSPSHNKCNLYASVELNHCGGALLERFQVFVASMDANSKLTRESQVRCRREVLHGVKQVESFFILSGPREILPTSPSSRAARVQEK